MKLGPLTPDFNVHWQSQMSNGLHIYVTSSNRYNIEIGGGGVTSKSRCISHESCTKCKGTSDKTKAASNWYLSTNRLGVGTFYSSYRWNAFIRHSHFVTSCCFSACIEVAHHHALIVHGISFWIVFVPGSSNRNGLSTRGSSGRETVPEPPTSALQAS